MRCDKARKRSRERKQSCPVLLNSKCPGENTAARWGSRGGAQGSETRQREKVQVWVEALLWFPGEAMGEAA